MAKYKAVYVDGQKIGYANKAEVSPEISGQEETATFDGKIIDTADSISWTISIDKIRYDSSIKHYIQIEGILLSCFKNKKTVKVVETTELPDGNLTVTTQVYNCMLTDKKYTVDAESRTVENLEFKGTSMDSWINNEKMPKPI